MGVKSIIPFSRLIIRKNQFFSARSYVHLHGYTHIRDRGPNWVKTYLSLYGWKELELHKQHIVHWRFITIKLGHFWITLNDY